MGICAGGGVAGYAKARSVPSAVAGLACGALFLGSGMIIKQGRREGHGLALLTSSALVEAWRREHSRQESSCRRGCWQSWRRVSGVPCQKTLGGGTRSSPKRREAE